MIDRGDIWSGNRTAKQYLGLLPGAGYGQFEHKADSLIAKFKRSGRNGQRLMYEQSHRDYLRSGYLHHRLPVMAVNHYRDKFSLPTKPSATKMPEN